MTSEKIEWTDAEIQYMERRYIENKSIECPVCLSGEIQYCNGIEANGNTAWSDCECNNCGAEWTEYWHNKDCELISYPEKFDFIRDKMLGKIK